MVALVKTTSTTPRFRPGRLVATPGVQDFPHHFLRRCLARHLIGDWGTVCAEDAQANEEALTIGERILSAYALDGERLWIITEHNRAYTTLLLPEEY